MIKERREILEEEVRVITGDVETLEKEYKRLEEEVNNNKGFLREYLERDGYAEYYIQYLLKAEDVRGLVEVQNDIKDMNIIRSIFRKIEIIDRMNSFKRLIKLGKKNIKDMGEQLEQYKKYGRVI